MFDKPLKFDIAIARLLKPFVARVLVEIYVTLLLNKSIWIGLES